ncbi:MAG TPA: MoaD/ThiS family protein [Chitinophagaceae bacterium]|jgi:molybdopterin synthase sulfur carrier subunit|nr:MoaD/ThiS family protein [Chitinophagaceae bacterium]
MKLTILAFGVAADIIGKPQIEIEVSEPLTAGLLKELLEQKYPGLKELASFLLAVNNEYAEEQLPIRATDEIAVIPPVSGG